MNTEDIEKKYKQILTVDVADFIEDLNFLQKKFPESYANTLIAAILGSKLNSLAVQIDYLIETVKNNNPKRTRLFVDDEDFK